MQDARYKLQGAGVHWYTPSRIGVSPVYVYEVLQK
jgi:hypothetical protein